MRVFTCLNPLGMKVPASERTHFVSNAIPIDIQWTQMVAPELFDKRQRDNRSRMHCTTFFDSGKIMRQLSIEIFDDSKDFDSPNIDRKMATKVAANFASERNALSFLPRLDLLLRFKTTLFQYRKVIGGLLHALQALEGLGCVSFENLIRCVAHSFGLFLYPPTGRN